jgi:hypothetical protein
MSVTEVLKGLGGWGLTLKNLPAHIADSMKYYGHVAIHTGRVDYRVTGDAALTSSRYTGVLRKKALSEDETGTYLEIGGPGMAMWLGDEDGKGEVIESELIITAQSFENAIRAVLPDSVTEGTLFNIGETFSGTFVFVSPREAVDYITSTVGAEWIVRGDGSIDAGLESDLFRTIPRTIVSRKQAGVDMNLLGLLGNAKTDQDVEDFTTRVVLLAQGEGGSTATADADINPGLNPYKDVHGNFVKFTRLVSESATDATNAPARAQLQLNRFSDTRDAMTLDSGEYDIKGDLVVGDYMWIHDPEIDLVDGANEVVFRGKRINPMKLRLTEMTWPVSGKFSVGYRDWNGQWFDLTDYVQPETGESTLVVGGYNRSLTGGGADGGVGGSRPQPNTTIPGIPAWTVPFAQSVYQSAINGDTKAQVELKWTRPNNTDGSAITDGDHYEIRWRTSSTPIFPVTWAQLGAYQWDELNTWDDPIQYAVGPWTFLYVPWTDLTVLIQELATNMPYEAEIRAVDGAVPPNYGDWSTTAVFQTSGDTLPPATPAPPSVAASRISVQITHMLGRADGGTFNLDADLHHFDIHGQYEPNFEPSDATLLGKLVANNSMIQAHVPAVGSFNIESTNPVYFKVIAVDRDGNPSEPSSAVVQTAQLIDDAHISNLTVSKVTAGTITADWLVGARIATAFSGTRVEMGPSGIESWNSAGLRTFQMDAATGEVDMIGNLKSGTTGRRVEVGPRSGVLLPEIRLYPTSGSTFAVINAFDAGSSTVAGIGMNSGSADGVNQSTIFCSPGTAWLGRSTFGLPNVPRGGYMYGDNNNARIGYFISGGNDAYYHIGSDRHHYWRGVMHEGNLLGAEQMIVVGKVDGNAFDSWVLSFGATMANGVNVLGTFSSFGGFSPTQATIVFNLTQTGAAISTNAPGAGNNGRYSWMMFQTP